MFEISGCGIEVNRQTNSWNCVDFNIFILLINGLLVHICNYLFRVWSLAFERRWIVCTTTFICHNGVLYDCMSHIVSFQISQINCIKVIYRSVLMQDCNVCWFTSLITLVDVWLVEKWLQLHYVLYGQQVTNEKK